MPVFLIAVSLSALVTDRGTNVSIITGLAKKLVLVAILVIAVMAYFFILYDGFAVYNNIIGNDSDAFARIGVLFRHLGKELESALLTLKRHTLAVFVRVLLHLCVASELKVSKLGHLAAISAAVNLDVTAASAKLLKIDLNNIRVMILVRILSDDVGKYRGLTNIEVDYVRNYLGASVPAISHDDVGSESAVKTVCACVNGHASVFIINDIALLIIEIIAIRLEIVKELIGYEDNVSALAGLIDYIAAASAKSSEINDLLCKLSVIASALNASADGTCAIYVVMRKLIYSFGLGITAEGTGINDSTIILAIGLSSYYSLSVCVSIGIGGKPHVALNSARSTYETRRT